MKFLYAAYILFFAALVLFLVPIDPIQGVVSLLCLMGAWIVTLIGKSGEIKES